MNPIKRPSDAEEAGPFSMRARMRIRTPCDYGFYLALEAFKVRKAKPKTQIDNASLHAGSPMYFYCHACGEQCDVLPESYTTPPKKWCDPCKLLVQHGVITNRGEIAE